MKILDRYLMLELIKITLLALFCLVLILSFFTLIDELDAIGKDDYGIWHVLHYTLLAIPKLALELFPVATVIGSMTTLSLFARNNELIIIRTSGISQTRLAWSFCKGAVILICLSLLISEILSPYAEKTVQQLRATSAEQVSLKTKHGFWSKDAQSFINVRKILSGDRVEEIYIYQFDEDYKLRTSVFAKRAKYENNQWLLEDSKLTQITEQGISNEQIKLSNWDTLLNPDIIDLIVIKPKFLSLIDLSHYIDYLQANGQNSSAYEQAFWSKIMSPLFIIIMVLMAIPIVKTHSKKAFDQRILLGCLAGITLHILNQTIAHIGIIYELNPALSISLPILLMLTILIWLLRKLG